MESTTKFTTKFTTKWNALLATALAVAVALAVAACPTEECGDGMRDANEACDEGPLNANEPNRCRLYCELPICGDSIIDDMPGDGYGCEQCDRGAGCEADCRTTTTSTGTCGDGILDVGEDCDDGDTSNLDGCESNCTMTPVECMGM